MANARYEHVMGAKKHPDFTVFAHNHGANNKFECKDSTTMAVTLYFGLQSYRLANVNSHS